jgi:hypothetical protein
LPNQSRQRSVSAVNCSPSTSTPYGMASPSTVSGPTRLTARYYVWRPTFTRSADRDRAVAVDRVRGLPEARVAARDGQRLVDRSIVVQLGDVQVVAELRADRLADEALLLVE